MRKLNPAHIEGAKAFANAIPCLNWLDIKVTDITLGGCQVEVLLQPHKHMTPFNGPYGGLYASLVDSATWWAIYGEADEDAGFATLDVHVDDLGMTGGGRLITEGRRVKLGRSICVAEAFVRDEAGKLLAHGTSKVMIAPNLPTIDDVLQQRGEPRLPPKFLDV
ncbi:MAG: PaaI family thioesterase [Ruminococcaceae bacterium]|nr:PaaI family thioesterase [Oscillospiraceae bacterium]